MRVDIVQSLRWLRIIIKRHGVMQVQKSKELVSIAEAASRLGLAAITIRQWSARRKVA